MTGGRDVNGDVNESIAFDTTELLTEGGDSWKLTGNLPVALYSIKGVSFQNRILMIGK